MRFTPYQCKVLWGEMRALLEKRQTLPMFIMKTDLMSLRQSLQITELDDFQVINACLSEFIKLQDLYDGTNDYVRSYLNGISNTTKVNKVLSSKGYPNLDNELAKWKLTNKSILVYMYLGVRGWYSQRNKMDLKALKEEVISAHKNGQPLTNDALRRIYSKVEEITEFIIKMRNAENQGLEKSIESKLDIALTNLRQIPINQEKDSVLDAKVNEIFVEIKNFSEIIQRQGVNTNQTLARYKTVLDMALKHIRDAKKKEQNLLTILNSYKENIDESEKVLVDLLEIEIITDELLHTLKTTPTGLLEKTKSILNHIHNLKQNTEGQALAISTAAERLEEIGKGIQILDQAITQLRNILSIDLDDNLHIQDRQLKNIITQIEALGAEYKEWRSM